MYSYMLDYGQEITNLGTVYPVKLRDIEKLSMYGWVVEKSKKSLNKEDEERPLLELLIEEDLEQKDDKRRGLFIHCLTNFIKLTTQCKEVSFSFESLCWFIEDDEVCEIDEKRFLNSTNFEKFRGVTSKQNLIHEKRYYNKYQQRSVDRARKLRAKKQKNNMSLDSMIEIVSIEYGILPKQMVETISYIEFMALFQRIQLKESARISSLYASSGNFKDVVIEDCTKELDIFKHPDDWIFGKENKLKNVLS